MNNVLEMTWANFNHALMQLTKEDAVLRFLNAERSGRRRPAYLLRLYSRYNRLRSLREKSQLLQVQPKTQSYAHGTYEGQD